MSSSVHMTLKIYLRHSSITEDVKIRFFSLCQFCAEPDLCLLVFVLVPHVLPHSCKYSLYVDICAVMGFSLGILLHFDFLSVPLVARKVCVSSSEMVRVHLCVGSASVCLVWEKSSVISWPFGLKPFSSQELCTRCCSPAVSGFGKQ